MARFLCKEKGEKTAKHKTFSLLPHMFIPYKHYCIDLMVNVVKEKQKTKSIERVKDVIAAKGEDAIELETRTIHECESLVEEAYNKLISFGGIKASIDIIDAVMTFGKSYKSKYQAINMKRFTSFEALAFDFFFTFQKESYMKRHFLFGTSSQKLIFSGVRSRDNPR